MRAYTTAMEPALAQNHTPLYTHPQADRQREVKRKVGYMKSFWNG